jgi:3-hydroxyisobutyrate dehydrogenase-like beta-hydroxyacid dehydrogenase
MAPQDSVMSPSAACGPVGVVGLGLMGTAIVERLLEQGFPVVVWNRTRSKAGPLLERGAGWSDNPLAECRRVVVSLYTTEVVEAMLDGFLEGHRQCAVLIDTTTGQPGRTAALGRRLAEQGIQYLDAPISGSSQQLRDGEATVMVGGDAAAFASCADLWPVLGRNLFHVGPCGSAARMKLISNLVLGLNRLALAEGLAFAEALAVPPSAALEIMAGSNAYSRAMDVKGRKMVERDYSVQARLSQHLKDVHLILAEAAEIGLELPLTRTHQRLLERAEAAGLGDLDNSAVLEVLRQPALPANP